MSAYVSERKSRSPGPNATHPCPPKASQPTPHTLQAPTTVTTTTTTTTAVVSQRRISLGFFVSGRRLRASHVQGEESSKMCCVCCVCTV